MNKYYNTTLHDLIKKLPAMQREVKGNLEVWKIASTMLQIQIIAVTALKIPTIKKPTFPEHTSFSLFMGSNKICLFIPLVCTTQAHM